MTGTPLDLTIRTLPSASVISSSETFDSETRSMRVLSFLRSIDSFQRRWMCWHDHSARRSGETEVGAASHLTSFSVYSLLLRLKVPIGQILCGATHESGPENAKCTSSRNLQNHLARTMETGESQSQKAKTDAAAAVFDSFSALLRVIRQKEGRGSASPQPPLHWPDNRLRKPGPVHEVFRRNLAYLALQQLARRAKQHGKGQDAHLIAERLAENLQSIYPVLFSLKNTHGRRHVWR